VSNLSFPDDAAITVAVGRTGLWARIVARRAGAANCAAKQQLDRSARIPIFLLDFALKFYTINWQLLLNQAM
jgi:hypothetical protein